MSDISSILRFGCWEAALFAAAIPLARAVGWGRRRTAEEQCLAVLAIEVTLESSLAALFSFTKTNSPLRYWVAAALCLIFAVATREGREALVAAPRVVARLQLFHRWWTFPVMAALVAPLVLLSFHPVEEIDSINYLHYLIEWMANRANPYTFATYYVAFWELSFLPAWVVTGLDNFFPLLALKATVMLGLAAWLVGRELGMRGGVLGVSVLGSMLLRHLWFEPSGVPTLKNDPVHGIGFLLLVLAVMRASKRRFTRSDAVLLAFGAAFAPVKYLGIFLAPVAILLVLYLRREQLRQAGPAAAFAAIFLMLTTWHYYVAHVIEFGSPFYPIQINLGFIHLPGTADLSNTSILYSWRDPALWRYFFWPPGGLSPAGLLFPVTLAVALLFGLWRTARAAVVWIRDRRPPAPVDWAAFLVLCGWLLYFRSVWGASVYPGDLVYIRADINTLRYVDGEIALSELLLFSLLGRFAMPVAVVNLASRLYILYAKIPAQLFPLPVVIAIASAVLVAFAALALLKRRWRGPASVAVAALALLVAGPQVVERNRTRWISNWNDLKPAIAAVRDRGLVELALPDAGYFAGHLVAAGNPVHAAVRSLLVEEIDALPAAQRPPYLAVLFSPGSEPSPVLRARYAPQFAKWGYTPAVEGKDGVLLRLTRRP